MQAESRKLLVIDDDKIVRQSISAYLHDSGYRVREAAGAKEGLKLFREFAPEIVLTDLKMPEMSGLEVLHEVHRQSPQTPVIVISGVGIMTDVVQALRLGATDFLIKPIADMGMLDLAIHRGLERVDLLRDNQHYRDELEASNRKLRSTLQIFERDQKAGRQVQERLLPPTPITKGGYTVSRYIYPSLHLSGDFIDYAFFQKRYWAFYLTDVSGHGASSAFVTIWLKFLVRQLIRDKSLFGDDLEKAFNNSPNIMLQGVNRELMATRINNHLTSFHGIIDSKSHKLRYSVGGHLPLPIMVTDEGVRYLNGKGKPLGLFNDVEWQVYEQDLPERFAIVIFSDGVLEVLPGRSLQEKEALLLQKMEKVVQEVTEMDASCMNLDAVCQSLSITPKTSTPDDIAVLMVTRGY
jgi:serine phosphatase RsbU (regulator of sigma subunit)